MSSEEFRVMHAIEAGMRNHEYVPSPLITQLAGLRKGGTHNVLSELIRHKLLGYDAKKADGYRLTSQGYDFLALRAFVKRETLASFGHKIGVGKESEIYIVAGEDGEQYALKLHRLGRSFQTIKQNRDYLKGRKHVSWLFLAHLAAAKEFARCTPSLHCFFSSFPGRGSSVIHVCLFGSVGSLHHGFLHQP
jgi:RIO kinase 2